MFGVLPRYSDCLDDILPTPSPTVYRDPKTPGGEIDRLYYHKSKVSIVTDEIGT